MTDAQVVEDDDKDGTKALTAGFDGPATDDTPAKKKAEPDDTGKDTKKTEAKEPDAKPKAESEGAKQPAAEPPAAEYVQLTKQNHDLLMGVAAEIPGLKRQLASAHGNIGHLTKTINEVTAKLQSGDPIDPNDEDFAELKENYPELHATLLAGLGRFTKRSHANRNPSKDKKGEEAAKTPQDRDPDAERKAEGERQQALIAEEYPDWVQIIGRHDDPTNEFRQWLMTQPEDYRERINKTRNGIVIIRAIDKFTAHKESAAASTSRPREEERKPEAPARNERLREAVQPRGDGGVGRSSAKTGEEELMEGFAS